MRGGELVARSVCVEAEYPARNRARSWSDTLIVNNFVVKKTGGEVDCRRYAQFYSTIRYLLRSLTLDIR